ncbi:hypothetical protein M6B38_307810 [Iris pallida]|uniref:Uncharacterized protein n=1 Tax=Iris pallida TaxID=29817 RepID=A0AAX6HKL1_IRIPA|nr:hypothetical protein M6B38_307810 [Iris pallida]
MWRATTSRCWSSASRSKRMSTILWGSPATSLLAGPSRSSTVPCIGASPPIRVPRPAEEAAPPPLLRRLWHVEEADSGMPILEQLELEEYINSVDVYVLNLYDVTLQMATLASYFGLGRKKHRMVGSDTTQQSLREALFVH